MLVTNPLEWFISIDDSHEKQAIYYTDRPSYHFPIKEEERGGKKILIPNKNPVWKQIGVEIPTRPVPQVATWLKDGGNKNIKIICLNSNGAIVEGWYIKNANIAKVLHRRGRVVDFKIISLQLEYSWANRAI